MHMWEKYQKYGILKQNKKLCRKITRGGENVDQFSYEGRPKQVTMFFKRGPDQRRYNNPLQDDIAAVLVRGDGAPPGFTDRDIVVHPHNWQCERISILSATATQW